MTPEPSEEQVQAARAWLDSRPEHLGTGSCKCEVCAGRVGSLADLLASRERALTERAERAEARNGIALNMSLCSHIHLPWPETQAECPLCIYERLLATARAEVERLREAITEARKRAVTARAYHDVGSTESHRWAGVIFALDTAPRASVAGASGEGGGDEAW